MTHTARELLIGCAESPVVLKPNFFRNLVRSLWDLRLCFDYTWLQICRTCSELRCRQSSRIEEAFRQLYGGFVWNFGFSLNFITRRTRWFVTENHLEGRPWKLSVPLFSSPGNQAPYISPFRQRRLALSDALSLENTFSEALGHCSDRHDLIFGSSFLLFFLLARYSPHISPCLTECTLISFVMRNICLLFSFLFCFTCQMDQPTYLLTIFAKDQPLHIPRFLVLLSQFTYVDPLIDLKCLYKQFRYYFLSFFHFLLVQKLKKSFCSTR